jgi:hypothetical protein
MKLTTVLILVLSLLASPLWAEMDKKLEIPLGDNLPKLELSNHHYTRDYPQNGYDEGLYHLPSIYPSHVMLCKRRIGKVGEVYYSMLCYKTTPEINKVTIDGEVVVPVEQSWSFKTEVNENNLNDALLRILEALSNLPNKLSHEKSSKRSQ